MSLEAYIPNHGQTATVACGDCRLCCRNALVLLLPEHGDDVTAYETQEFHGRRALKRKPDGACWYLGPDGCTIHGRHPVICRTYSCVDHWHSMDRNTRRQAIKERLVSKVILDAGRQRALGEK